MSAHTVFKVLDSLDDWIAKGCMLSIMCITVAAVFMRYVVNDPLQWVEEILIALFLWAIMLGASSAMKNRGHVSIDALVVHFSKKNQHLIRLFNDILSIVVLLTIAYLGYELAMGAQDKITPILQISYMYIDIAVPVGACWMVLHILRNIFKDIRAIKNDHAAQEVQS